jgi:hypothetical protein
MFSAMVHIVCMRVRIIKLATCFFGMHIYVCARCVYVCMCKCLVQAVDEAFCTPEGHVYIHIAHMYIIQTSRGAHVYHSNITWRTCTSFKHHVAHMYIIQTSRGAHLCVFRMHTYTCAHIHTYMNRTYIHTHNVRLHDTGY